MKFRKQHKGKALEKISARSLIDDDRYYISVKRDGRMNQIAYDGDMSVKFWTGGGHEYHNAAVAAEIVANNDTAFHIECEYTGASEGKLGDRGASGVETKFRTAFNKGLPAPDIPGQVYWVYDILGFDNEDVTQDPFEDRLGMLMQLSFTQSIRELQHTAGYTVDDARAELQDYLDAGFEGLMLTHATHIVGTSGRSNLRIKLKETPTGYATIVGTVPGTKEREGTIGALLVEDEEGLVFSAGTGLNGNEWVLDPEALKGVRVKFGYESINDGNYIQPRYLGAVLDDKTLVRLNEI